jgi:hypothetical protein
MAGAIESITQTEGPIQFFASGTYKQPANDNANIHIHTGFKPKFVLLSIDPAGAVAPGIFGHWAEMADADSTEMMTAGVDLATGVTIRDNWQVTTGEYYIRGGESVTSAAGDDDYIRGFSIGDAGNGSNDDVLYYIAIG